MATGKMIVRDISWDARIWEQLSESSRQLFIFSIPHQGYQGELPRKSRDLRILAIPLSNTTDDEAEKYIKEWFATMPEPLAKEGKIKGESVILLSDFERCNWDLPSVRMRRERALFKKFEQAEHVQNVQNVPYKGSEEKNNSLYIASFERFWKEYPRKEGRKPALEAWLKLRPEAETVTLLLQALLKYKSCADVRRGIVLSAARWLTEERWTDEIGEEGNGDPIYA